MDPEQLSSRYYGRGAEASKYEPVKAPGYSTFGHASILDSGKGGPSVRGTRYDELAESSMARSLPLFPSAGPTGKRGSRACVSCKSASLLCDSLSGRKGKNRCEFDPSGTSQSCRRCLLNGTTCVFEKASDRKDARHKGAPLSADAWFGTAEGRVTSLENSVKELANGQSQIQQTVRCGSRLRS